MEDYKQDTELASLVQVSTGQTAVTAIGALAGSCVLSFAFLPFPWQLGAYALAVLLAPAFAWIWTPPQSLHLTAGCLVERRRSTTTQMRLTDIIEVREEVLPYKGKVLRFCSANGRITLWSLGEETHAFRKALGEVLGAVSPRVLASSGARHLV